MDKCPYCNTSFNEIRQTGFVGCSKCYREIEELRKAVKSMYSNKVHRGKRAKNGSL